MDREKIFSILDYDFYKISEDLDRIEIFELMEETEVDYNSEPLHVANQRSSLKSVVRRLYNDLNQYTIVVKRNNKIVAVFAVSYKRIKQNIDAPIGDFIYIKKSLRKYSKLFSCIVYYVMDKMYPSMNIQINTSVPLGMDRLTINLFGMTNVIIYDTLNRVKKILKVE